jgi:hypothetical protein
MSSLPFSSGKSITVSSQTKTGQKVPQRPQIHHRASVSKTGPLMRPTKLNTGPLIRLCNMPQTGQKLPQRPQIHHRTSVTKRIVVIVFRALGKGCQLPVGSFCIIECWMIYRGSGFLVAVWFGSSRALSPPAPVSKFSLFRSLPVCRRSSLLTVTEERGWGCMGEKPSLGRRESLILYNHLHSGNRECMQCHHVFKKPPRKHKFKWKKSLNSLKSLTIRNYYSTQGHFQSIPLLGLSNLVRRFL